MKKASLTISLICAAAVAALTAPAASGLASCKLAPPGQNTPPYCVAVSHTPPSVGAVEGVTRRGLAGSGPKHCVARTFPFRLTVRTANPLRRVRVFLDGGQIAITRSTHVSVQVPIAGLRRGTHRLTVVATDQTGLSAKRTFYFRACGGRSRGPQFTG